MPSHAWMMRQFARYDEGDWWFLYIFLFSFFLVDAGIIIWTLATAKVGLYLILVGFAIWCVLIFCGWSCKPGLNPVSSLGACIYCSSLLIFVGGMTFIVVRALHLAYKREYLVRLNVTDFNLTQFNFTSTTSTLVYNLSLAVKVGPNKKKTGVYYKEMEAVASYQGHNFTNSVSLSPFYLAGRQRQLFFDPVFQGQQAMVLTDDGLRRYKKETAAGCYSIGVTLSYWGIRTNNMSAANDTLSELEGRHQLKGVSKFKLTVPLWDAGSVHSGGGAAMIVQLKRRDGLIRLVMAAAPPLLVYVSLCF